MRDRNIDRHLTRRLWPSKVLVLWLVAACVASAGEAADERPSSFDFPSTGVTFNADIDGARLNDCALEGSGEYRVVIRPENEPVNNSAWYAFRITAKAAKTITIELTYEGGKHRYHPKVSTDGKTWRRLSGDRYRRGEDTVTLRVDVGPKPVWVSAQEMIGVAELNAWTDKIAQMPFVEQSVIGRSVGDRPIRQLTIAEGKPQYALAIVGRQHPPEVTGSMALMAFVETITEPSDLAKRFRQTFETIVVPLMNPDGVAAGNWRHNLHGVDLNRDWGPFRQPEVQAVRDSILEYQNDDTPQLAFFLDFHSTQNDIFYVQTGEEPVWPDRFSQRWLKAIATRLPDYRVRPDPNTSTRPLSKVWAWNTMKVPAVIYEVGDNTDRTLIRRVAQAAAEEMMRMLLEEAEGKAVGSEQSGEVQLAP